MAKNPLRTMSPAALHTALRRLVETMPEFEFGQKTPEMHLWLGRAHALVAEAEGLVGDIDFKQARSLMDAHGPEDIIAIVYRALGVAELDVPTSMQGAFIPAKSTFDAYAAVSKIFDLAKKDILIVDPYLSGKFLIDIAPLAESGVSIRLLGELGKVKPTLAPAHREWVSQHGESRPIEVRLSAPKTLHDRMIGVDGKDAWTVGQSFADLAKKSPTTFAKVDVETAALKFEVYEELWKSASQLPSNE